MPNLVREVYLYPNLLFLKNKLHTKKPLVILIGTPIHRNLGDHLIAEVEFNLLKKIYINSEIVEIPTEIYLLFKNLFVQYIRDDALIFISGGGWMGDVWAQDDRRMQDIISTFSNHKVFVLPQTLYFDNEESDDSQKLISDARRIYAKCTQLTMLFRDKSSFEIANRLYKDVIKQIILFPDMALFKEYSADSDHGSGILLCLRDDRERVRNREVEEAINEYVARNNFSVGYTSTITKHAIPIWLRKILIKRKIHEFEKYELVITDRLHGMIYAYLAGTRCVAIDNKTHKVSGVFNQWIAPYELISVLSEKSNANELITAIKKMNALKANNKKIDMSEKKEELKKILEGKYES